MDQYGLLAKCDAKRFRELGGLLIDRLVTSKPRQSNGEKPDQSGRFDIPKKAAGPGSSLPGGLKDGVLSSASRSRSKVFFDGYGGKEQPTKSDSPNL